MLAFTNDIFVLLLLLSAEFEKNLDILCFYFEEKQKPRGALICPWLLGNFDYNLAKVSNKAIAPSSPIWAEFIIKSK